MTDAAKSIYYFSIYLFVVGLTLVFMPNIFLTTLQMPETNEVWIRVVGLLAFVIGFYYNRAGATNLQSFFGLTIPARVIVFISFVLFALMKWVSPIIIGIGVIDLAGALWTWMAMKKNNSLISKSYSVNQANQNLKL